MKKGTAILITLLFIGVGVYMLYQEWDMGKRCTSETVGTVESVNREKKKDNYYAVIDYEVAGEKYRITTSASSSKLSLGSISFSKKAYQKGDQVTLLYDPEYPNDAMVKGKHSHLLGGIVVTAVGSLALILSILKKRDTY